jgi:hypothetical protein
LYTTELEDAAYYQELLREGGQGVFIQKERL